MCDERVTSNKTVAGKITRQTITESSFTGVQQKSMEGRHSLEYTESREVKSVNGKPVPKGGKLKGPYILGGGFSSVLSMTFAPKNMAFHNYKVVGAETLAGRTLLAVEFATKNDQKELWAFWGGKAYLQKDTGKAWLDPATMQAGRLDRQFHNLPRSQETLTISVEYAPVTIDGKSFWMPKTVRSEWIVNKTAKIPAIHIFLAEYSNYRKFVARSAIVY